MLGSGSLCPRAGILLSRGRPIFGRVRWCLSRTGSGRGGVLGRRWVDQAGLTALTDDFRRWAGVAVLTALKDGILGEIVDP